MVGLFEKIEKENGSPLTDIQKDEILKYLDMEKGEDGSYLDAFNRPVSYNGIRTLKRPYVKFKLTQIHLDEFRKCSEDIFYFVNNYCKILTKTGISFLEMREYQQEFLRNMVKGEDLIGSCSRQSGKSVTTGLYLLWKSLFTRNINIGITANKQSLAAEILDKIKKVFIELPIWLQQGIVCWNKGSIEFENGTRIMTAACNGDAFRGFSLHLLVVDECAFIKSDLWENLTDSVFPAQEALAEKQKILISTPNGMNHWYHLVKGAKNKSNGYNYFENDWRDVPRYNRDGSVMSPEDFKYQIIQKNGEMFFNQNFGLEFLGSSSTLISSTALKNLEPISEDLIIRNHLFDGLKIFEEPQQNRSYIVGVDPKKEGIDKLAIQVLDVTELPFKQVASANLNCSYLNAPGKIFDLGNYYNLASIVIENNIDNSIVDLLHYQYEYDGEIYKEKDKKILGFRTTTKSKKILLSILKKLIETDKLILNDKETIDQFFVFVEKDNGTFSAQDGFHDDLISALWIALAPFIEIKNFDDFKGFVNFLDKQKELEEKESQKLFDFFSNFSFSTSLTDEDLKDIKKESLNLYN